MTETSFRGAVPMWTLGDRMGKALSFADVSVQDMADYLGLSRNSLSGYINDRLRPKRQTVLLWAMRTGVSLEWLETGEGSPTGTDPDPGSGVDVDALDKLTQAKRSRSGAPTQQYLAA